MDMLHNLALEAAQFFKGALGSLLKEFLQLSDLWCFL
jgi:hypothetical protein